MNLRKKLIDVYISYKSRFLTMVPTPFWSRRFPCGAVYDPMGIVYGPMVTLYGSMGPVYGPMGALGSTFFDLFINIYIF